MGFLVNTAAKVFGLDSWVVKMAGSKAYLGAASLILTGIGTSCTGLVGLIGEVMPCNDFACYVNFARGLGSDANAGLLLAGWAMVSKGLADIGNRHATEKLEARINVVSSARIAL